MIVSNKFSGWAIITAVLLYITRMIPMITIGAQDFPPSTITGYVAIISVGQGRWELSHLMLLASLALFFMGYVWLYAELRQREQKTLGLLFIVTMGGGLLLKVVAGMLDGFLVPAAANQVGIMAKLPTETAHAFVGFAHEAAMVFFGQGQTANVLGIGLASVALWQAKMLNRWLVAIGAGLSGLALLGLVVGVFGDHWQAFKTTGPALMVFNLWQLALGIAIVRHKPAGEAEARSLSST